MTTFCRFSYFPNRGVIEWIKEFKVTVETELPESLFHKCVLLDTLLETGYTKTI